MPRCPPCPALDRCVNAKAPLILHWCGSILFAVAWGSWHDLLDQSTPGVQIVFVIGSIGLIGLWHSRLIRWIAEPIAKAESLSGQIRETLNAMPEGLMVTNRRNRIMMANETLLTAMGLSSDEVIGKRPESLPWVTSEGTRQSDMPWKQAVRVAQAKQEQLMRYKVPDGSERYFSINASPVLGDQSRREGAVVTIRDVTQIEAHRADVERMVMRLRFSRDEVRSQNRELKILADQDPLTGCLNRRAFFDVFGAAFEQAVQSGSSIACMMIDVDHFKQVNDRYGHPRGDEVLKAVALTLRQTFIPSSVVGRYGGEEFCVVLPQVCMTKASDLAEQVRSQIQNIPFGDEPSMRLSASIGISGLRAGVATMEDMIRQADECLYQAKRNGRNQVVNRDGFMALVEGAT